VLACDIPFVHRFLYDKGLGLTIRFVGEEEPPEIVKLYPTALKVVRVVHDDTSDIVPAEPFRPALTVLSFDIENAIRERTIFTICGVVHKGGERVSSFRIANVPERQMLEKFASIIEETDPDVITGYNIGGYDIPLLLERAEVAGLPNLPLGRDRGPARDAGERLWRVSGRVIADAWWSA
jgi:DNA polymerase I